MKINIGKNPQSLIIAGIVAIIGLILFGSLLGSIFGLLAFIVKMALTVITGIVGFAFKSVFNFALVSGLGYLGYRWYKSRSGKNSQEAEVQLEEGEVIDLSRRE